MNLETKDPKDMEVIIMNKPVSVSYTHLDVYKRQV